MDIAIALRSHQVKDPILGDFFIAMHRFTLRTLVQFFAEDIDIMGYPCLGAASLGRYRMAEYTPKNSFMLPHAIALNFMEMDTGIDVCEHIAHELVHMWEHSLGYDLSGNAHNEQFHNKMSDYGIATQGVMGRHVGYMGDVWQDWLKRNEDLKLETFKLGQT